MQDFFRIALSIDQHFKADGYDFKPSYCILLYPAAKLFVIIVCGTLSNRKISEAWPCPFQNTRKFGITTKIPKHELVATLSSTSFYFKKNSLTCFYKSM